jgi:hypothetical protein
MTKAQAIAMRDTLRGGEKNFPLRVFVCDNVTVIDETNITQITKWDDTNGVIYSFRLVSPTIADVPNNLRKEISITAVPYENIQAIEAIRVPVKDLDTIFTAIGAAVSATEAANIKKLFDFLLSNDLTVITPTTLRAALGGNTVVAGSDDYYNGKFGENFKETRPKAEINAYVDSLINNDSSSDEEPSEDPEEPTVDPLEPTDDPSDDNNSEDNNG